MDERASTIREMFSRIAYGYDRANRWMTLGLDRCWRRQAAADLAPKQLGARPRILDLCAGTLDSTLEIYRQYPEADITAMDFSKEMLEHGFSKLGAAVTQRVVLKVGDAQAIDETDGSFDAIFCAFGLRNLSDIETATLEQARCLKRGGRLTILEFFRPTSRMTGVFIATYGGLVFPLVGRLATKDADAYRYLRRSIEGFMNISSYCDLLARRGFEDMRIQTLAPGIASVVRATKV